MIKEVPGRYSSLGMMADSETFFPQQQNLREGPRGSPRFISPLADASNHIVRGS